MVGYVHGAVMPPTTTVETSRTRTSESPSPSLRTKPSTLDHQLLLERQKMYNDGSDSASGSESSSSESTSDRESSPVAHDEDVLKLNRPAQGGGAHSGQLHAAGECVI